MMLQPRSFIEPETFFCRAYAQRMSLFDCMKQYVDANALKQKDRPCFGCVQGDENRVTFAKR